MPAQDPFSKRRAELQADISRTVIVRFCCTVGILVLWILPQPQRLTDGTFAGAMIGAAAVTGLIAGFVREPFRGPVLNRWDETIAYLGLAALGHALSVG